MLEAIYEHDPDSYGYVIDQVFTQNEISKIRTEYPRKLPKGYWMSTKLSGERAYRKCRSIIQHAGLSAAGWQIDYSPTLTYVYTAAKYR